MDKGPDGRLINTFSWSFSRHNTFTECQKKYWYTYYGSWEGWPLYPKDPRPRLDPLAAYLYAVKQMQHFPMFVGSVVHTTLEKALKDKQKTGKLATLPQLQKKAQELLLKGIKDSEEELWRKSPKHRANLFEVYYGSRYGDTQLDQLTIDEGREKVDRCLEHWMESPIVQNLILSPRSQWMSIEVLDSFKVEEKFKVYVVIDFAMKWLLQSKEDVLVLFDWKTGKETEKTIDQLYSYALYGHTVWGFSYDKMILSPFYLDSGKYQKVGFQGEEPIRPEKVAETERFIAESSKNMLSLVDAPTVDEQIASNKVLPTACSYTAQRRACNRCPFRELCQSVEYQDADAGQLRAAAAQLIQS